MPEMVSLPKDSFSRMAICSCSIDSHGCLIWFACALDQDGLTSTRHILAERPNGIAPQIIAMTANVYDDDREACKQAGMIGFLGKPVTIDQLRSALSACVPLVDANSGGSG